MKAPEKIDRDELLGRLVHWMRAEHNISATDYFADWIDTQISAAVLAEREACAKVGVRWMGRCATDKAYTVIEAIVEEIRARGEV